MVFLIFMILSLAYVAFGLGYGIYNLVKIVKSNMPGAIDYKKEIRKLLITAATIGGATLLTFFFLSLYQGYKLNAGEWIELLLGSLLFGGLLSGFIFIFVVNYYAKEVPEEIKKWTFRGMICGGVSSLIGLLLLTNGLADHIAYPLANGLNFKYGFTSPLTKYSDGFGITWYAIFILSGAILVYFLCDHRLYVEYGKHGIAESTFLIALPAGIIGARIGYVVGEWNVIPEAGLSFAQRVAEGEWWCIFAIWEGGLTILSGAISGIVVGVLWYMWRNKQYSIWVAVDLIVPTILIAQGIGRIGNYFNCEVHGFAVETSQLWWVPKIIVNNMRYSSASTLDTLPVGQAYMPLFYIELLTNFIGYFVIRYAVEEGLKKYRELGDLAFSYVIWYGLTRVLMEPLRVKEFNMGTDKYWSWFWSIVFVVVGTFLIFANHLVRYLIRKHKNSPMIENVSVLGTSIACGSIFAVGTALLVVGIVFMANNPFAATLEFNKFNVGLILLVIAIALYFILGCGAIYLSQGFKKKNAQEAL